MSCLKGWKRDQLIASEYRHSFQGKSSLSVISSQNLIKRDEWFAEASKNHGCFDGTDDGRALSKIIIHALRPPYEVMALY